MAGHSESPLSHVLDRGTIELPWWNPGTFETSLTIPWPFTKFMVMELIAGLLMVAVLVPTVRHIARNQVSRGWFMNLVETLLLFIRDEVARPAIGGPAADRFLPYLWTVFFFVLFNNMLGLIPGGASPTGNINVTAVLALMTLGVVLYSGMKEMGATGFWVGLVPHMEVPALIRPALWGLMFFIEVAGLFIRHTVLSVRLFANMFAGHVVLTVILGFILTVWGTTLQYLVVPASLGGVILLSVLELFVAVLQAYIFTFLSALFIGSAIHPH